MERDSGGQSRLRSAGDARNSAPATVPYVYGARRSALGRRTLEAVRRIAPPEDPEKHAGNRKPLPPFAVVFPGVLTRAPDPEPDEDGRKRSGPKPGRRAGEATHYKPRKQKEPPAVPSDDGWCTRRDCGYRRSKCGHPEGGKR